MGNYWTEGTFKHAGDGAGKAGTFIPDDSIKHFVVGLIELSERTSVSMGEMCKFRALIVVTLVVVAGANAISLCYCKPGQSCWPTAANWASLNSSIGGNLVAVQPVASPCHNPNYDAAACAVVQANLHDSVYRSAQPGTCHCILAFREATSILRLMTSQVLFNGRTGKRGQNRTNNATPSLLSQHLADRVEYLSTPRK